MNATKTLTPSTEVFEVIDMGNAKTETKQRSPWPPYYADSTYLLGDRPNGLMADED